MTHRTFVTLVPIVVALSACGDSAHSPAGSGTKDTAAPTAPAATFAPAVKVTPQLGYGYEPTVVVDRFGNIYATAHKENWQLALGPDLNSPTMTRSMSWAWLSTDDGQTWKDIPGLTPASLEQHQLGDEGDMAFDAAGHLYYVDTYLADNTITRWTPSGRGQVTLDHTQPVTPTLQALDDRPWITAHGDGHVFFFGNMGNDTYPLGGGSGSGVGPGRYTVYASLDGGQMFDPFGVSLKDSGWCRPASDIHHADSHYLYVFCTDDGATLYSYVSTDDAKTFERYKVGTYKADDNGWPTVQVAPDGSIWALHTDTGKGGDQLRLLHSTDYGQTWSEQNITSSPGQYIHAWLAVAADGKLGLGVYHKAKTGPWLVYGGIWQPGEIPQLVSLDPSRPAAPASSASAGTDYMGSYFGPDGKLSVIWDRAADNGLPTDTTSRDIWFARSQ